jgi:tetratricopeptide (TPR) repeat protein
VFIYIKGVVTSNPRNIGKKTVFLFGIFLILIAVALFYFDKKIVFKGLQGGGIAIVLYGLFLLLVELIIHLMDLKFKKQIIIDSADNKGFAVFNGKKKTQYYWREIHNVKFDKERFQLILTAKRKLIFDKKTVNIYLLFKHIPLGFKDFDYTYRDSFFANLETCVVCGTIAFQNTKCLLCGCTSWRKELEELYSDYDEYITENQLDIFVTMDKNEKFNNFKMNNKCFNSDPNWKPKVTKEEVLTFSKNVCWDNDKKKYIKLYILTIVLIVLGQNIFSQDTAKLAIEPKWEVVPSLIRHSPTKKDTKFCDKFKNLITEEPNEKNYSNYYYLAKSLWELGRLSEAESMFLKIVNSEKEFYTKNYYHSSDIPGRKTTNTYGYGSYTSNFKNYACRYLTKIYIEQEKYEQAMEYLDAADKIYVAKYNCGTGYRLYRNVIDGLYELCYYGLNMYDTIIKKSMSNYSYDFDNRILIETIKKKFSSEEINNYLLIAENSINFIIDTFQTSSFYVDYGKKNEKEIESKYISGTATMNLFGVWVEMNRPDFKDGDVASKELFLKEFKESRFYKALTNKK